MNNLIKLNKEEIDAAREFADMVDENRISHGVVVYRTIDGDMCYRLFGGDNYTTYYQGMLMRIIHILNNLPEDCE